MSEGRSLSALAQSAVNAQTTEEIFLVLLTIDEASLDEPIRAVNNTENITSRGDVFAALYFDAVLPPEDDGNGQGVQLVIDNVDQQIVRAVREAVGRPQVTLEVVLASDPDTVEAGPFNFELDSVDYDASQVRGRLTFDDVSDLRFPAHTRTPGYYPGL